MEAMLLSVSVTAACAVNNASRAFKTSVWDVVPAAALVWAVSRSFLAFSAALLRICRETTAFQ